MIFKKFLLYLIGSYLAASLSQQFFSHTFSYYKSVTEEITHSKIKMMHIK